MKDLFARPENPLPAPARETSTVDDPDETPNVTIYAFPKHSLKANKIKPKDKRIWEKHRLQKGRSTKLPKLKN